MSEQGTSARPHSDEAEQSVLGALLIDNAAFGIARELLAEGDFYRHDHRLIFSAIAELVRADRPADVITTFEALRERALHEEAGGMAYLNALAQAVPSAANIRAYAAAVREHAKLRGLIATADDMRRAALDPQGRKADDIAAGAAAQVAQSLAGRGDAAPPFAIVQVNDLGDAELPPLAWAWDGYVPCGEVTLLAAHGGAGKSYLALMLAACTALGLPLFGVPTTARPVVVFSGEDPAATVRRRLQTVLRALEIDARALAGRLIVVDATGGDPALMRRATASAPELICTRTMAELRKLLAAQPAGVPGPLLIVDNASDAFDGNEIARAEVRHFVRDLACLVRPNSGAVLLLAHVAKDTARGLGGSESYSGSTAWHNSARSRLHLRREKDSGALVLEHEKSTHGPLREPLRLVWPTGGVPTLDAPHTGIVGAIDASNNARALLRLVHEFTKRGEFVSAAVNGRPNAAKLLRGQSGFPARLSDAGVFDALRNAERRGWLERVSYAGPNRHPRERWNVTPQGRADLGIRDAAPSAPCAPSDGHGALDAHAHGSAPCAPCAALGVVGDVARAELGAAAAAPAETAADVEEF